MHLHERQQCCMHVKDLSSEICIIAMLQLPRYRHPQIMDPTEPMPVRHTAPACMQAGGLGSLNLPSHSLQASSLGPQQQPAQQLPHGPQSLLGPAATSRTPGMWGAGQLPMASSHLQGMQPNELRLQQEQLLLQHQAQAAQQQRNRAAGFPQFSGAQIGAPRLAQHAGHPLGGGRLDAGSLPLSQLLNAQNLPLRQGALLLLS